MKKKYVKTICIIAGKKIDNVAEKSSRSKRNTSRLLFMRAGLRIAFFIILFLFAGVAVASAADVVIQGEALIQDKPTTAEYQPGYIRMIRNGYVFGDIFLPEDKDTVVVTAASDYYLYYAHFILSIDGNFVGDSYVPTLSWTNFTFNTPMPKGNHSIIIRFDNDAYLGWNWLDTNLRIDKITFVNNSRYPDLSISEADITFEKVR